MLKKYQPEDFKLLKQWVTDAEILLRFSGPDWTFPLHEEEINRHICNYPDRQFYIGYTENNVPYAFGQLIWNEANAPRLGRILVGEKNNRGKGMGQRFIKELITESQSVCPSESICLFVADNNFPAIGCYTKVGFKFSGDTAFVLKHKGLTFNIIKLVYRIEG